MVKTMAVIDQNGNCVNIILIDTNIPYQPSEGLSLVDYTGQQIIGTENGGS